MATNETRRKTQRSETRDTLWEGSGSQLRVRISFSSQWLVTDCRCYTLLKKQKNKLLPRRQTWKLNTPSIRRLIVYLYNPVEPVLHYKPASRLLCPLQMTSSSGGEMVCECTPPCAMRVTCCMRRSIRRRWRWDPAPCWRWAGLLHLLWEADWIGREVEVGR